VGTFVSILRRDRNWGVGSATVSREIVPLSIPNLHQKPTGLAPKVTGHCLNDQRNCFVEFCQLSRGGVGGGAGRRDGVVAKWGGVWRGSWVYKATPDVIYSLFQ
jgi:hypothetical protein